MIMIAINYNYNNYDNNDNYNNKHNYNNKYIFIYKI